MNFLNGMNPFNWYSTTERVTNDAGKITTEVTSQPTFTPRDVVNPLTGLTAGTQALDRWATRQFSLHSTLRDFQLDVDMLHEMKEKVGELYTLRE